MTLDLNLGLLRWNAGKETTELTWYSIKGALLELQICLLYRDTLKVNIICTFVFRETKDLQDLKDQEAIQDPKEKR